MSTTSSQATVSGRMTAVLASIPPALAAAVGLLLRTQNAEQVAQLAAFIAVLVTAGVPWLQRSAGADCRRAAGRTGGVTHLTGPLPRIVPSTTTVVLSVALGAAAFWLLYLLTTWLGLGSLGYWSGEYPSDPSEVHRAVALRCLPVLLPGVFAIGVAMAHRLHDKARPALLITSALFTIAVLVTNAVLVHHWGSEPLPEYVYVPLVLGGLAWLVCHAARRYAARTQHLFDLMQAVRVEFRRAAEHGDV
ncbi:hypothetical protein [Streptomyces sp. GESEQ-35]|uniref:hypothetical protein n=1 Tax=Streptomyces sp. GESEQ-35 TaxID=2812657 RepID=UPI001B332687|nr:hypothetical protein [Streptomyces sp. GESEQ-35]